ncbi:unnamed protein product [Vicia faba]|uniref:Uncharacterized protein n=1 Tax=Vicia faba TaxID=3906 RepID=A0AAV1B8F6_VICFA|nr:unnamed protein product [Vicia faba]
MSLIAQMFSQTPCYVLSIQRYIYGLGVYNCGNPEKEQPGPVSEADFAEACEFPVPPVEPENLQSCKSSNKPATEFASIASQINKQRITISSSRIDKQRTHREVNQRRSTRGIRNKRIKRTILWKIEVDGWSFEAGDHDESTGITSTHLARSSRTMEVAVNSGRFVKKREEKVELWRRSDFIDEEGQAMSAAASEIGTREGVL